MYVSHKISGFFFSRYKNNFIFDTKTISNNFQYQNLFTTNQRKNEKKTEYIDLV